MNSSLLADNVSRVRERIAMAAERASRPPDDITLVAVTKYVDVGVARALVMAGCLDLGESRPQELWHKAELLDDASVRWHLVGHLQRNKARKTLAHLWMLQSVDSQRLLDTVGQETTTTSRELPILVEVNISGDSTKHGFAPDDVKPLLDTLPKYPHLAVRGLMCMARLQGGLSDAQSDFACLRELRDRLRPQCPDNVSLDELSMGMSRDFEVAIVEGATIVRIGSALFEGIER